MHFPRAFPRALCLVAALVGGTAEGQVTWTQHHPATSPPPSLGARMTFDEARQCAVLVTGRGSAGDFETWEWDGTNWTQRFPSVNPPFRYCGLLAFDRARHRTVLAGGVNAPAVFDDTWEWDGVDWKLRFTGGPFGLATSCGKAMAFDEVREQMLLVSAGYTWEWDGAQWSLIASTAQGPHPPAIFDSVMAYDRARRRMVMFDASSALWEWDGAAWECISKDVPAYGAPSIAWDARRGRTVLFGRPPPFGQPAEAQTWEWDGASFTHRQPKVSAPWGISSPMTYDPVRRVVILTDTGTWQYTTTEPASLDPLGTSCPGTAGLPVLTQAPFHLPWVGDTVTLNVAPIPSGAPSFLLLGLSNTIAGLLPLPADLTVIGMNGCTLYTSMERVFPMVSTGEAATVNLVMPTATVLAGTSFYTQAAIVDALANPFGLIASNAQAGVLGAK